jgi:hypothetical protein
MSLRQFRAYCGTDKKWIAGRYRALRRHVAETGRAPPGKHPERAAVRCPPDFGFAGRVAETLAARLWLRESRLRCVGAPDVAWWNKSARASELLAGRGSSGGVRRPLDTKLLCASVVVRRRATHGAGRRFATVLGCSRRGGRVRPEAMHLGAEGASRVALPGCCPEKPFRGCRSQTVTAMLRGPLRQHRIRTRRAACPFIDGRRA